MFRWTRCGFLDVDIRIPVGGGNLLVIYLAEPVIGGNNLQSTFEAYSFYNKSITPIIIGAVLAVLTGYCLLGGGKRIVKLTSLIVPVMGIAYVLISLVVILFNIKNIPAMFVLIFKDAFDFKSILGGVAGSCMIYGEVSTQMKPV